ncbi:MAG: dihydrofolate reductase [Parvularculaceae bacterium]
MKIALVVAVAQNGVIGRDGGLAWKISDDLKWFKKVTTGKPIIMGRRTFESIGKALPKRVNIVVSRSLEHREDIVIARTLDEAISLGAQAASHLDTDEICIIGGADIYAQTLEHAGRMYLTEVKAEVDGDVYFPPFDPGDWTRTRVGEVTKSEKNEYSCEFFILDRR